jgi:hypothetical protein
MLEVCACSMCAQSEDILAVQDAMRTGAKGYSRCLYTSSVLKVFFKYI